MAAKRVQLLSLLEAKVVAPAVESNDSKEELFFEAMKEVLSTDARLNIPSSLKMMRSKVGPDTYYESVAFIFRYMETSTGRLNRNETYALLVKLLKAYVYYIRSAIRMPLTIKTFFNVLNCFDAAVEQSYPGYREYGFLRAIISPKTYVLEGLTEDRRHSSEERRGAADSMSGYIWDPGCC